MVAGSELEVVVSVLVVEGNGVGAAMSIQGVVGSGLVEGENELVEVEIGLEVVESKQAVVEIKEWQLEAFG